MIHRRACRSLRDRLGTGGLAGVSLAVVCLAAGGLLHAADEQPAGHRRMLAILREIAEHPPEDHPAFPQKKARELREALQRHLEEARGGETKEGSLKLWRILFDLGQAEVKLGDTQAGIGYLLKAHDLLAGLDEKRGGSPGPAAAPRDDLDKQVRSSAIETSFNLGVAYMRLGEDQNCCVHENAEACILPLRGGGLHRKQEGSRAAIKYFRELLESPLPDDQSLKQAAGMSVTGPTSTPLEVRYHQSARWLLNIAYMTVGGFPDEVPPQYLLPPETFSSETPFPRFENVAPKLRLNTFGLSGGVIVDDFDNDGNLDIATSSWDLKGQLRFFRSNGDGTFSERTEQANLLGLYGGLNMVQADYDNDGDIDIFVTRGGWFYRWGRHPNSLVRNNGDGTFTDVTFEAGLGEVHYPTKTAAWGDYDNDGDLDLFIANETSGEMNAPTQLFRNNGDGTFVDVAPQSAAQGHCFSMGTVWGDYDDDGYSDLFISGCVPAALLHNNGDGTFANVAKDLGVTGPKRSFPTWFWDFDNDGALDLFIGASSGSVGFFALNPLGVDVLAGDPTLRSLQESINVDLMHLYRNDGHGGFEEVAREMGLTLPAQPMGANFGDLDNDGFLDFHLGTGDVFYSELTPNLMFLNRGGKRFVNVTMAGGFGHLQKGHGVSFADIDNDGDQDVYVQIGGAYPGDKFYDALFENPGFDNHWITVKLAGRRSNRAGIGARIHARIVEGGKERSVYRHVNSGGSFGCDPLRQTVGLGKAERLVRLEVFWPTTGRTQVFEDVPMDQAIAIEEDGARYTPLRLKGFKLGGPLTASAAPPRR